MLKKFKISKKGPFSLYIGSPSGPPQNMKLMGPEGDGPPGPPPFLRPWPLSTCTWRCFGAIDSGHWIQNPLVSKNIASAFATTARALRSENSYVTISDEITVFVDTMLPACRHSSVESETSVTSLPAWCCTAHVRSMNWRMSVSDGAGAWSDALACPASLG